MYVIIEGIDGSGKDSQGDLLWSRMMGNLVMGAGTSVLRVNEPDDSLPTGKLLRQMLKDGSYVEAHAAMFLADRMAMLATKVRPALEAGNDVVSVRSWMSTIAYQQENWPLSWLYAIHEQLPCKADHLILLDLDAQVALDRATKRPGHNEFYEKLDIQMRNRQRYLDIAKQAAPFLAEGGQVHIIPAEGPIKEVQRLIVEALGV